MKHGCRDPKHGVELFNPRGMVWSEHFELRNAQVVGLTPNGRGTARLLNMNDEQRVQHRRVLIAFGEFDVD